MSRLSPSDVPDKNPFNNLMGHRPEILESWMSLERTLLGHGSLLPTELKENARREMSLLVGCEFCATVGGLPSENAPSIKQSLASALASQLGEDHREIDDSMFEILRAEFTDPELVELIAYLCFKLGANVFGSIMKLQPADSDQMVEYAAFMAGIQA